MAENFTGGLLVMPIPVATCPKLSMFNWLKPGTAVSNALMVMAIIYELSYCDIYRCKIRV